MSARSSLYQKKVIFNKPFQASSSWHQLKDLVFINWKNTVFQKWMDFSREIKFQENQFTFLLTRLSIITSLVFWWYQLPKKLLSLEKKTLFLSVKFTSMLPFKNQLQVESRGRLYHWHFMGKDRRGWRQIKVEKSCEEIYIQGLTGEVLRSQIDLL